MNEIYSVTNVDIFSLNLTNNRFRSSHIRIHYESIWQSK